MQRLASFSFVTLCAAVIFQVALVPSAGLLAEETQVQVRVISKGAKFIGTSMGGALIRIENADTGEVLATGKTSGSTGDTGKIMKQEARHHTAVSSEGAAVFKTELDLDEPTRIRVTAYGPLAQRQAAQEVSATQWIIPGKDIVGGDALLLLMPGFVVDVLEPPAHIKLGSGEATLRLTANVTLMCGCPIEPDGLWDANAYEVSAIIKRNGEHLETVRLQYAGKTSQFAADLALTKSGAYEVAVYAYDPANGNTGIDFTTFIIG